MFLHFAAQVLAKIQIAKFYDLGNRKLIHIWQIRISGTCVILQLSKFAILARSWSLNLCRNREVHSVSGAVISKNEYDIYIIIIT